MWLATMKEFVHREAKKERGKHRGRETMGSGGSRRLCGEMCVGWWRKDHVGGREERSDVGGRSECSNGG